MRRLLFFLIFLTACSSDNMYSPTEPEGKRVYVGKNNISFILPDSSLIYSKSMRWGPCCSGCSYYETNGFFHNRDTSVMVSVTVTAFPNVEQRGLPWYVIANEKQQRYVVSAMNRGTAVIEHYVADSANRTIDIEYRLPKRPEPGRLGQASHARKLTFYGPQRTIQLWFFGPDTEKMRQAIAVTRASVRVDPTYLSETIKPYPESQYID